MSRRRVVGILVHTARVVGFLLIIMAILSMPEMRAVTDNLAAHFTSIASILLGLVGIVWLIAIQVFLRFFDQFLSRN
jgi:uncharacterized membrane protein